MSVLRIHKKQQNFVILDKTCLNDKSLSWGAKGLHSYLMSLPDDWQVRVDDLQHRARNGRDAVRNLLNELEHAGFILKSVNRNAENGRFGGMEYLVLEVPEPKNEPKFPAPEKTSSELPSPETQATGNPGPEKATLINNNINQVINKTAAADEFATAEPIYEKHAAAVIFSQEEVGLNLANASKPKAQVHVLSQEDTFIGEILTSNQERRVDNLVEKLNVADKESLALEIKYCLINKNHFTACGKEFSKKLNAIRVVILRGDWQTPAGMIVESKTNTPSKLSQLQQSLKDAKAEEVHFNRLLSVAKEDAKKQLAQLVDKARQNLSEIEAEISLEIVKDNVTQMLG